MKRFLALLCAIAVLLVFTGASASAGASRGAAQMGFFGSRGYDSFGPIQLTGTLPIAPHGGNATLSYGWATPQAQYMSGPVPTLTLTGQTLSGKALTGTCGGPGGSASSPNGGYSSDGTSTKVTLLCQGQADSSATRNFTLRVTVYGSDDSFPPNPAMPSGGSVGTAVGSYVAG